MKKFLGESWKTTLAGYVTAILIAVQPLLTDTINWEVKQEIIRYAFRLVFAVCIAVFGKWAADSKQVKKVDARVDEYMGEMPSRTDQQLG